MSLAGSGNSEMDSSKVDDESQRSVNDGDWICPDSQYVTPFPTDSLRLAPLRFYGIVFVAWTSQLH